MSGLGISTAIAAVGLLITIFSSIRKWLDSRRIHEWESQLRETFTGRALSKGGTVYIEVDGLSLREKKGWKYRLYRVLPTSTLRGYSKVRLTWVGENPPDPSSWKKAVNHFSANFSPPRGQEDIEVEIWAHSTGREGPRTTIRVNTIDRDSLDWLLNKLPNHLLRFRSSES